MANKKNTPNGYVVYRGPSMIDGKPIVMIATGLANKSDNTKTGNMVQTWILREDVDPFVAVNTGADESICGACPHRGDLEKNPEAPTGLKNVGRSCYIKVWQAPLNVWRAYKRGIYPDATVYDINRIFSGRAIRLGSYGDPFAIPLWIIDALGGVASYTTGYTHQWRNSERGYNKWLMASADSASDRFLARAYGYRTFRVRGKDEALGNKEISCPASKEMGAKTNCAMCKACGGTSAKTNIDIAIMAHGEAGKVNSFYRRGEDFGIKQAA